VIPYSTQSITAAEIAAVSEVLNSGWLTQGPVVPRFEARIASMHDVRHAVAVSNATAGLHLACLALGVGAESRVWTSPISYVASANCAAYCGAEVDFVDIEPSTGNLSVAELERKLEVAQRAGKLPDALIAVDYAGQPADLLQMRMLADRYGFALLDDASHALGATISGRPIGSHLSDLTVFSFHPVKIITTGEGGMVVTQNGALAERLRRLRSHGVTRDPAHMRADAPGDWYYEQVELGYNYRMTDIQAALGCVQLDRLPGFQQRRRQLAQRYDSRLTGLPLQPLLRLKDRESALHLYPVRLNVGIDRADVFARLRAKAIGVQVHYIPIHLQPYWQAKGFKPGDFPEAESYYASTLSLPLYPAMSDDQQDIVLQRLGEILT
jgi:UDP-4-amino-4,6-dideoxy-N-acetyl-beta-L-altrosamine transaminase